mgnify:CR=1 FL=1
MGTDTRIEVIPAAWRRTMRRAGKPALALALVLGGAGGAAALTSVRAPATTPVAATGTTSLWLSGSSLSYADAQEASGRLGWAASSYSLPGVGISRSTSGTSTLGDAGRRLLPSEVSPDVVVLQGGEADNGGAGQSLSDATASLLAHVQQSTDPGTRIVLVGPIPGPDVPDSLRRVNEVLARVAQQSGVEYLDALAEGWQAGQPALPEQLATVLNS